MESRVFNVMEVCGTHTHALMQYGLREVYRNKMKLISGPGCPVCVTSQSDVDRLIHLCDQGVRIYTFGDLMKVPGSFGTLREKKALGADVREIYNPLEIIEDMKKDPAEAAVFAAIGFETTAPLVAGLISEIESSSMKNLYIYNLLKRIPPAIETLLSDPDCAIDGLLCPGHVATIIGELPFKRLSEKFKKPFVIAGFTRELLVFALEKMYEMLVTGVSGVFNAYYSTVMRTGNPLAIETLEELFGASDAEWRGLGIIPNSGYALKSEDSVINALQIYPELCKISSKDQCPCGQVLKGKLDPEECKFFGIACNPERPMGPCMVSSEGSCHAAFLYRKEINT
ncbi:MAG: hydrogenase formation protein HypD [Kosmotoga sp.]|uniref:hydrogenase formation protein HypD n=1 Tax=Kosmotoga sp. TaxID=1955248 RepID=UPI0025B7F47B|nr:hydrogenase formation protein HypD [Kosmotoga sp.]MCD6159353.1 hydrogenase formation protein HypD [Kosmotoga sp.]